MVEPSPISGEARLVVRKFTPARPASIVSTLLATRRAFGIDTAGPALRGENERVAVARALANNPAR